MGLGLRARKKETGTGLGGPRSVDLPVHGDTRRKRTTCVWSFIAEGLLLVVVVVVNMV